jgi:hypothetical protein
MLMVAIGGCTYGWPALRPRIFTVVAIRDEAQVVVGGLHEGLVKEALSAHLEGSPVHDGS